MDEKKVREAIYCMKASIGETMCEECVNYCGCDHTKMDDMMRTAIEALEKQLPKRPRENGTGISEFCYHCGQRIDWSEEE